MYFPVGWPKILALPATGTVLRVSFDREKFMFAVLRGNSLEIWFPEVKLLLLFLDSFG